MPRPRESYGAGRSETSESAGSGSSGTGDDSTGGSSSNSSGSGSISSSSRSSSDSNGESSRTSDSNPRGAVKSRESGSSRATTASRRTGASSLGGRSDGSTTSSSSSDGGAGSNNLKSRMKSLFNSRQTDQAEAVVEAEELGELENRVDANLLTKVQEYDAVPSDLASYGKTAFWDERYAADEEVVEWYHPWANLAPTLTEYMDEQDEVLVCGCGNSEMSADMYDDGFERTTNVDISRVVIYQMSETYKAYDMEWKADDLSREAFPEERFDVALDKACLDSIVCEANGAARANNYLQQMDRILRPEGAFICVSFAPPEERLELLEYWDLEGAEKCLAWDVHVDAIGKPELPAGRRARPSEDDVYYMYVCIKDPEKTAAKKLAKERKKREQEKKLAKMLGFKNGRGRGRGRGRR